MLHLYLTEEHVVQLVLQQFQAFIEQDLLDHQQQLVEVQELVVQHALKLEERDEQ